jgi:plasmid stability protein
MSSGKNFFEVNVPDARTRDKKGRFKSLGYPVESAEVRGVDRGPKERDYRKVLESMEPEAFKVLKAGLKDSRVPMKDRIAIAQDVLTRLHGKTVQSQEAEDARRKVESMSLDELKKYVQELAGEVGFGTAQVVN